MTPRVVEGDLDGGGLRIGVAVAIFNERITADLASGALLQLDKMGVSEITVMKVPGAWELPLAAQALASSGCHGVVAVGAVIKGETDHYDVIVEHSAAGLREVALRTGVPVANAVLTVRDLAQALDRSAPGPGNQGTLAAKAAVMTARALHRLASA